MAVLKKQQVIAGGLALAATLGVSACSNETTPDPGPSTTIEQTIQPTHATAAVEIIPWDSVPAEDLPLWWEEVADLFPAEHGLPASFLPDYVFSDVPRGAHEQWIFDDYPEHWAAGVRAASTRFGYLSWTNAGDPKGERARDADGNVVPIEGSDDTEWATFPDFSPSAMVQYINGARYDGTPALPLALDTRNPDIQAVGVPEPGTNTGVGRPYSAHIYIDGPGGEQLNFMSPFGEVTYVHENGEIVVAGDPRAFAGERSARAAGIKVDVNSIVKTRDDAIAFFGSGNYWETFVEKGGTEGLPESQMRDLYPGEVELMVFAGTEWFSVDSTTVQVVATNTD